MENKEKVTERSKKYYTQNREKLIISQQKYDLELAIFDIWFLKIQKYEECRRDPKDLNLLQVKCKYCSQWMNPTNRQIGKRLNALKGNSEGDSHIHCSKACKRSCPIFNQNKYPKGFQPSTSREVQPDLRKMVLERDNWTCQRCGKNKEDDIEVELHCHHIDPVVNNPIESADIDNCITLCKECHKFMHTQIPGCKLGDLIKCGK